MSLVLHLNRITKDYTLTFTWVQSKCSILRMTAVSFFIENVLGSLVSLSSKMTGTGPSHCIGDAIGAHAMIGELFW